MHNNDELLAWNEFRSIKNVRDVKVVPPAQYDETTLQLKENPRASLGLDCTSRVKSPRSGDEDKSDNRFKRKRTVGHRRQGMSSPLPLDPSNNNKDDDNVDGGLVGRLPPKSVLTVASTTQPLAVKFNDEVETSHPSSDDDEINAWIWTSCRKGKTTTVNTRTVSGAGDID